MLNRVSTIFRTFFIGWARLTAFKIWRLWSNPTSGIRFWGYCVRLDYTADYEAAGQRWRLKRFFIQTFDKYPPPTNYTFSWLHCINNKISNIFEVLKKLVLFAEIRATLYTSRPPSRKVFKQFPFDKQKILSFKRKPLMYLIPPKLCRGGGPFSSPSHF